MMAPVQRTTLRACAVSGKINSGLFPSGCKAVHSALHLKNVEGCEPLDARFANVGSLYK